MADGRATSNRVPDACGDPECEALCEPSGDGYSRCAGCLEHALTNGRATRERAQTVLEELEAQELRGVG